MAGDDIDYSHPANYGKMVALLEKLRDYYGVKDRPVDALFINTLLAFTHENIKNAFRKDHPEMEDKKNDCFRRAGYLAKNNTKGNAPKRQREWFSSRNPKQ